MRLVLPWLHRETWDVPTAWIRLKLRSAALQIVESGGKSLLERGSREKSGGLVDRAAGPKPRIDMQLELAAQGRGQFWESQRLQQENQGLNRGVLVSSVRPTKSKATGRCRGQANEPTPGLYRLPHSGGFPPTAI